MATKTLADMLFSVGITSVDSSLLIEVVAEYAGPWKSFVHAIQMVRDNGKR